MFMRRVLITAFAAAAISAVGSTAAQASVTVSGDSFAIGAFSGTDCPIPAAGGFNNCWATQNGTVGTQPTDPTASRVVAAIASNGGGTTVDSTNYPTVDGGEFTVTFQAKTQSTPDTLLFTYLAGQGDPVLHYISIKQADGYELFYDAAGFASGTTYSFNTDTYFGVNGGGFSHVTVFDSTSAVPEPATWALMLLGFGGIGVAMRRRRRHNGTLMQVA